MKPLPAKTTLVLLGIAITGLGMAALPIKRSLKVVEQIPEVDRQAAPPADAGELARLKRVAKAAAAARTTSALKGPASLAPATVIGPAWEALGPAPTRNGQVTAGPNNEICGAIQAIAAHPSNADILYIGSVGGGVWKTTNATNASPTWTALTDTQASQNIGALEFDTTDATSNTLVAGIARVSSFAARGGALIGVLRTTDGGSNWTNLGAATFANENITSVAARGAIILAASDNVSAGAGSGLFRSTDTGGVFTQISGAGGTGLPAGSVSDLVADPQVSTRFYAAVRTVGIYRSDDTGATWTPITGTITGIGGATNKIEMAVHNNGVTNALYVGVVNSSVLASVWRSANPAVAVPTWTQMDTPVTHNGAQGDIHFSIVASPSNSTVVYIGGDRIAGAPFTGNLFRGDASLGSGTQFATIMGANANNGAGSGNTTPHADSREMVFDANGNIIEGDDGGIYRRSSPTLSTGIWTSVNGTLGCFESHDVAWDAVSNVAMHGAQDNGTHIQISTGSTIWTSISGGDGGDVAIDDTSSTTQSVRYGSSQNLGGFYRKVYNAANGLVSTVNPALTVLSGGPAIGVQFVTPVEVNKVAPTRIAIGGSNSVYESLDQGDTVTALSVGAGVNRMALAYGGRQGGVANPDVLYFGSGSTVRRRTAAAGAVTATPTPFPGGTVQDVVLDSTDWTHVYVADSSSVYLTPDSGTTWQNITGDLTDVGTIRCLEFFKLNGAYCVAAGTGIGVYVSFINNTGVWYRLGSGLPNAVAFDLSYNPTDNVLLVGTLGHSSYKLTLPFTIAPVPNSAGGDISSGSNAGNAAGVAGIGTWDTLRTGAVLAADGTIGFRGNLLVGSGAPPVTAQDFQGIWKDNGVATALKGRSGTIAPGVSNGVWDQLPINPWLASDGRMTFGGLLRTGSGAPAVTSLTDGGVWTELGNGTLKLLLREGDSIPGIATFVTDLLPQTTVASSTAGNAAFTIRLRNGAARTTAVVRADVSGGGVVTLSAVATQGGAAPAIGGGTLGTFYVLNGNFTDPRMNDAGNIAFAATLNTGGGVTGVNDTQGVWFQTSSASALTAVARAGATAPGTSGAKFIAFERPSIADGGAVAFRGFIDTGGDNGANNKSQGIWATPNGTAAALVPVIRTGDTGISGMPGGSTVASVWSPFSSKTGRIAFRASIIDGGIEKRAIFSNNSGTMKMLYMVGSATPDLAGETFDNFDHPVIGDSGHLAFTASTNAGKYGIWKEVVAASGSANLLVKVGDSVTTAAGVKVVASISVPGTGSTDRSYEQEVIDAAGEMLVFVTYVDASQGLLLSP